MHEASRHYKTLRLTETLCATISHYGSVPIKSIFLRCVILRRPSPSDRSFTDCHLL